jgi:hypothetical protein
MKLRNITHPRILSAFFGLESRGNRGKKAMRRQPLIRVCFAEGCRIRVLSSYHHLARFSMKFKLYFSLPLAFELLRCLSGSATAEETVQDAG